MAELLIDKIQSYNHIYFFIEGTIPRLCPEKTYAHLGSGKCAECPAGSKCSRAGLAEPEDCGEGYYNNATGQSACSKCEAGRECLNAKESIPCRAGYYSREGESNCTRCPPGTYSMSSAASCLQCPAGNECIDGSHPVNCSEGYFSGKGDGVCKLCDTGGYKFYFFLSLSFHTDM